MISLTSPTKTRAHNWSAGAKIVCLCLATAMLFVTENIVVLLAACTFVIALYAMPGSAFLVAGLRQLKLLWPFIFVVGIWHLWSREFHWGGLIVLRMLTTVGLANLVTMTTKLSDMIDVVRTVTGPLRRLGLNSRVLELAIALVIRLTPVLVQKGQQLTLAWMARSQRTPGWRIILPFTVLAMDDADHIAEALRARGGFISMKET